ncbi:Uncharacterised protein [Mycobacteroides abscessus subsp. abscessus]|nr:Uncharacterised protein [Mycobacteroides abscessus subsp. abscessus]
MAARRWNIRSWLRVISITITLAVIGACVAAARKAAIDSNARVRGSLTGPANCTRCSPIPAPIASAGVKMPPGMPAKYEATVATHLAMPKPDDSTGWPFSSAADAS